MAAAGCISMILVAYYYMEKTLFLVPCPLCYAQRIVFGLLAALFILSALFPKGRTGGRVYGVLLFLTACGGCALSIRHLYLQSLPKGQLSESCGQDFYRLVQNTPIGDTVYTMITGSGDCGVVQWTLFGLSIPGWALIAFIGFAFWGLIHNAWRD